MMRLNEAGLREKNNWIKAGYQLPKYDREEMKRKTKKAPFWIHFGAGNIFRAFQANAAERLLNENIWDRGLVVAEGYDYEIIDVVNRTHDDYSILVTMHADGMLEKTVVGSVAESLKMNREELGEWERLTEIFREESLQMASFTITEKGYSLKNPDDTYKKEIERDFTLGPSQAESYMGKTASLLYERFQAGGLPIAMVSMDNCSKNGSKLSEAMQTFARMWVKNGLVEEQFVSYVNHPKYVSFPWTMIDKITPRPDASVAEILKKDGLEGADITVTKKHTFVAPFVNAEECEYLVIEDAFPNGRPDLEKAGFFLTDQETVDATEKMKVCTCLNPLHTSLAVFGCLLGYDFMSDAIKDPDLKALVEEIGYQEGLPVVKDPGILDPKEFLQTVLEVRIPNPYMPDTPQRIATDTSQKLPIRFGETIKAYQKENQKPEELTGICLVFAGWLRYLMGTDDAGKPMELSPDPFLTELTAIMSERKSNEKYPSEDRIKPILENEKIFGINLYSVNMAKQVYEYLKEMCQESGAVRVTLASYKKKLNLEREVCHARSITKD